MRDDGALRGAGRARRVDDRRGRRCIERRRRRGRQRRGLGCEVIHLPEHGPTEVGPCDDSGRPRRGDQRLRRRVAENVPSLALAVEHVDRHEDDAEARGGEEEVDVLEAVRNLKREPIACARPRAASARPCGSRARRDRRTCIPGRPTRARRRARDRGTSARRARAGTRRECSAGLQACYGATSPV